MSKKVNPIIWTEIYVADMNRAKRFYETVFGFKLRKIDAPGPDMEMWGFPMEMDTVGGSGALVRMKGVDPGMGSVIPYFHCDEVSVEQSRVEKAGGKIHKAKFDIGPYGWIALVHDTEGNMIGLHMPAPNMTH